MSDPIIKWGKNVHDVDVAEGYYAVDPAGNVCLVPIAHPLKPSWRLAMADDFESYATIGGQASVVNIPTDSITAFESAND